MDTTAVATNPAINQAANKFQYTQVNLDITQVQVLLNPKDSALFGAQPPNNQQANGIVLERAFAQLQQVVSDARAALGLPEGSPLDTSPEATATRIADFALGFFSNYLDNHPELADDAEGRQAFLDLIVPAIDEGIRQARDILGSIEALNPEVNTNIDTIRDLIQGRIDAFLQGE